jgi:hypothetical protein
MMAAWIIGALIVGAGFLFLVIVGGDCDEDQTGADPAEAEDV